MRGGFWNCYTLSGTRQGFTFSVDLAVIMTVMAEHDNERNVFGLVVLLAQVGALVATSLIFDRKRGTQCINCQKLDASIYSKEVKHSMNKLTRNVKTVIASWDENDQVARPKNVSNVLKVSSKRKEYLEILSAWIAEYLAINLEKEHNCYMENVVNRARLQSQKRSPVRYQLGKISKAVWNSKRW